MAQRDRSSGPRVSATVPSISCALFGAHGLAHHVEPVGNQRVFQFNDAGLQRFDIAHRIDPGRFSGGQDRPPRPGPGSELRRGLAFGASGSSPRQRSSDDLQVDQAAIEAGLGQRRRQVADERGARAALGDGAFAGIVGGIEIDIRQISRSAGPASRLWTGQTACRA